MVYLGGKGRIASKILPIMLINRKPGQWWVEPFCGGCNTLAAVWGRRIGADSHAPLIALWRYLCANGMPAPLPEWEYHAIRENKDAYPLWKVGYAGFVYSFNGKYFGGYIRDNVDKRPGTAGRPKPYVRWNVEHTERQIPVLKGVQFLNTSYPYLPIPRESLIYCDPPYQAATGYRGTEPFDHAAFWQWARERAWDGHTVYVSEYTAPPDFACVWADSKPINRWKSGRPKQIERLFTYRPSRRYLPGITA